MKKFTAVKNKYLQLGLKEDDIDYAITAVKEGSRREHLLDNLTAGYRNVPPEQANALLNELYTQAGGEFKKENRTGYIYGIAICLFATACLIYGIVIYLGDEGFGKSIAAGSLAVASFGMGGKILYKALRGRYRDTDDPFSE
ncbi:MAG: hypothetical protein JNM68_03680 [Dinghuibacter sp.]|nr:hypothetical protein [Dinghuibacter sp.]